MWKWLGGCLIVVLVLVIAATWWGYRAMQDTLGPDGTVSITIGASPQRVFASLADGDSLATWMAQGNTVRTARRGALMEGDSIHIAMSRSIPGAPSQGMTWSVKRIVPETLIQLDIHPDTRGTVVFSRLDSLVTTGDSTTIISRIHSPMLDSQSVKRPGQKASDAPGLSADLLLSMLRLQAKLELQQLKLRLESSVR